MARNMEMDLAKVWAKSKPPRLPHEIRQPAGRLGAGSLLAQRIRPSYIASAVHFDGATNLQNASLTAANSSLWSASMWVRFASAVNGSFYGLTGNDTATIQSETFGASNGSAVTPISVGMNDGTDADVGLTATGGPFAFATWFHLLISVDASVAPAIGKFYLNGVDVTNNQSSNPAPRTFGFSALPALIGADATGDNMLGDMAEVWVAPGVSLLVAGDIPLATRRKFIDANGFPANPTGFPASAMLFSGDASTFGTNQGTGGAFTTTGTLTNASTSPSS